AFVRVLRMGDISREFCGGTHVRRTGEIGPFRIVSESSVAAGIRRIEAVVGLRAYDLIRREHRAVQELGRKLNAGPDDFAERVDAFSTRIRDLEKQVKKLKSGGVFGAGDFLAGAVEVNGFKVASGRVDAENVEELKSMADAVREKMGSGVGVLGAEIDGKASIVVVVTDDLIAKQSLKAGDIVKRVAAVVGGSGGGRPHLAMAGGKDAAKLDEALAAVPGLVGELIKG
ncbi:MAG: DHHA1 domain-containing protein, partial [Candidatus Latescibacterota bacterium]